MSAAERDVPGSVPPDWYASQVEAYGNRRDQQAGAAKRAERAIARGNAKPGGKSQVLEIWTPEIVMTETLIATPPVRPKFVIDGMLPTGLIFLAGRPKGGKSLLALQMAVAVASGTPFWGRDVDAGRCWYIDIENARWRIYDRLTRAGIDASHVPSLAWEFDWKRGNQNALTAALDAMPVKLLVIDVWAKFRAPLDRRQDQYEQEGNELAFLARKANTRAMSILCVGHTTKSDLGDVYSQIGGSTAVAGGADALFVLRKEADDRRVLHMTGRDVAESRLMLRLGDDLQFRYVCDADAMVSADQLAYLRAIYRGQRMPSELARVLNVTKQAVSQMLQRLREGGYIMLSGGIPSLTPLARQMVEASQELQ